MHGEGKTLKVMVDLIRFGKANLLNKIFSSTL